MEHIILFAICSLIMRLSVPFASIIDGPISEALENKERASARGKKGAEARWGNQEDKWWE